MIKQSYWVLLLCLNSGFFIFLAWLAYPETFKLLVLTILMFTFGTIFLGIVVTKKQQRTQHKLFYQLLKEPSVEHEMKLQQTVKKIHSAPLHDLAVQLRQLHDALQEANYQSSEYESFIESWVHEIKTPLSLSHFILQNRQHEMSSFVYQRLNRANITIHDYVERILFYAKLQATHVDYNLKAISTTECLEDVLLELDSLVEEQHVHVQTNMEDLPIISDDRALHFILTQLFVNAIKYQNTHIDSYIWIDTGFDDSKGRYYIQVADNGLGILQADLPFIFDKGFTGNAPHQKQATGMGLFLVKKLCDDLQIEIEFDSRYREGFTIQLFFPKVNR